VISMTDNEATRTTFVRTRSTLLRGRGRKFCLHTTLVWRTQHPRWRINFVIMQLWSPLYLAPFGRNLRRKFSLGVVSSRFWETGGRMGLKMGLLSSPVVTSYRLPTVTIGLSRTVFTISELS